MTFERRVAAALSMGEETWARHANPWSVWTRFTALPLLIVAVWSRVWLGWWALVPTIAAVLWIWFNPRIFPRPRSTSNWASKGVLGERVWLNRDTIPVPLHHRVAPHILTAVSGIGMAFVVWGLVTLHIWPTLFGTAFVYMGKVWFMDRMVWIYEEMKDANPEYRSWLY